MFDLFGFRKRRQEQERIWEEEERRRDEEWAEEQREFEKEDLKLLFISKHLKNLERGFSKRKALAYAIEDVAHDKGMDTDELIEILQEVHPEMFE